jgi:hydroxypyruvate reductase
MAGRREFLTSVLDAALAAVRPEAVLPPHLPPPPPGHVVILAAGKAAAAMAAVAEHHYLTHPDFDPPRVVGLAATRHGHGMPTRFVEVREAGHPLPDEASVAAAETALRMARCARADDLVLVLLSGGASANWAAPADGLTLADKQTLTRALLRAGLPIAAINTVRKHLSRIKGGRLARHAFPAKLVTIGISDVPGDDPAVIGSGPTVPDPTTLTDACAIVSRYRLDLPDAVTAALNDAANESPKPDDPIFRDTHYQLAARPLDSFRAAEADIRAAGYDCIFLGDRVEGEAREVAAAQARLARDLKAKGQRAVILSGGELTVTIRGNGRGGPNQEFALALATELEGVSGIAALAGDTDGTDGGAGAPDDPAGAYVDGRSAGRGRAQGFDPAYCLADNNSTAFLAAIGGLISPGPTFTNVNDFRAIMVDDIDTAKKITAKQ